MSSPSRASRQRSRSTRRRSRPTRARPWARSRRSTTSSVSLFARVGTPHCPVCGRVVSSQTPEEILKASPSRFPAPGESILAPVIKGRKGEYQRLFERLRKKGFLRARVNGALRDLEDDIPSKNRKHTIEVLVDTVKIGPDAERRLREAVAKALEVSDGEVLVVDETGKERFFLLTLLCPYCEVSLAELEPRNFSFNSPYGACPKCHGLGHQTTHNEWGEVKLTDDVCPDCRRRRLKKESLSVKIGGRTIHDIGELSIPTSGRLRQARLPARPPQTRAGSSRRSLPPGRHEELGMSYLQLNRTTASLSGGEAQRVRLAAQVGARLRGVLYVLDEPTIGLHQRDNDRLIGLLRTLRDEGNSIVVVEHDEQTIRAADYLLDLGPGRRREDGGFVQVAEGPLAAILASPDSLTDQYLRGAKVPAPSCQRRPAGLARRLHKAREHNLKEIDVRLPLGGMTAVTGVSGSGKSTLVYDILFKASRTSSTRPVSRVGAHEAEGIEGIDKVVAVDQKPIGRTPRSNPATYTGLFAALRDLLARTPEARARGYGPGVQLPNVRPARCEGCAGGGVKKIEMHFLPDVFVTCDRCGGKRYNKETRRHLQGQDDRRLPGHDGRRGLRAPQGPPPAQAQVGHAEAGRAGLHPPRPAGPHALGRRGPAHQADQGARAAGHRPDASTSSTSRRRASTSTTSASSSSSSRISSSSATRRSSSSITLKSSSIATILLTWAPKAARTGGASWPRERRKRSPRRPAPTRDGTSKRSWAAGGRGERTVEDMAFKDVVGNERIKKILKLALERGRVPNSLIFGGPDGVGKKAMALTLAKTLNCLNLTTDSCDECTSCEAIDKGVHPDVMVISAEKQEIKIEQTRLLKQMAYLRPMTGKKRVFIVVDASETERARRPTPCSRSSRSRPPIRISSW